MVILKLNIVIFLIKLVLKNLLNALVNMKIMSKMKISLQLIKYKQMVRIMLYLKIILTNYQQLIL